MSASKSRKSAAARKEGEPVSEHNGDWISTNYWIKVGLTRAQVKTLTAMGRRRKCSYSPCATMARQLICLALANLPDTEARLAAFLRYINAEGFSTLGAYFDGTESILGAMKEFDP